jgi:hypothetical protein
MDKETIQQIAQEVVARLPTPGYDWMPLVIQTVLMLLVAGGAAFLGSYFRTRGQNLATKHDFEVLQDQLKANTTSVETIKSQFGQRDWAQREWTNLRRIKLEALLKKMHDCEAYLDRQRSASIRGETAHERNVISEFETIADLYFLELREVAHQFENGNVVPADHRLALRNKANQLWHTDSTFKRVSAGLGAVGARHPRARRRD